MKTCKNGKNNRNYRLVFTFVIVLVIIQTVLFLTSCSTNNSFPDTAAESDEIVSIDLAVYIEGVELYDKEEYISAMECFMKISSDSNEYEQAQTMLLKCKDEYCVSVVEKANKYATDGDYEIALKLLDNAKSVLRDNMVLISAYDNIFAKYRQGVCNIAFLEADAFVSSGDYSSAITTIDNALVLIKNDEELMAKRAAYTDAYVFKTITSANAQYVEYNYDSILAAESIIESALKTLPDNQTLLSKLNYYKELEPVKLLDLVTSPNLVHNVSTSPFKYVSDKTDTAGVTYNDVIEPSEWFDNYHPYGWSETYSYVHYSWLLDYQYQKITGAFFYSGIYKEAPIEIELKITPSTGTSEIYYVSNKDSVKYFDVDLTGAKEFEISLRQSDVNGTYAYLSNVYIWKK